MSSAVDLAPDLDLEPDNGLGLGLQGSLFEVTDAGSVHTRAPVRRDHLTRGAWVDVCPGWLAAADPAYRALLTEVPWQAERRQMWDNVVDVPRLLAFYGEDEPLPHPALDDALAALNSRYAARLGEPFRTAGLCLYRDGRDSVAWHGDRFGRGRDGDTLVAIVSLGSRRNLMLRPRGGGSARRYPLAHGDLVVMGGSCQRTWDHCIPKTAQPVGPRISVQFVHAASADRSAPAAAASHPTHRYSTSGRPAPAYRCERSASRLSLRYSA